MRVCLRILAPIAKLADAFNTSQMSIAFASTQNSFNGGTSIASLVSLEVDDVGSERLCDEFDNIPNGAAKPRGP